MDDLYENSEDKNLTLQIYQWILFIDGIYLYKVEKKIMEGYSSLLDALKITIPDFDINKYDTYIYNEFELRILMDIAILHYRIKDDDFSYKIFNLLTNKLDHSSELFIITLYNLAIYESIKGLDEKALETINKAIEFSNKYRITSSLHLCYYEKALMEHALNDENYKNSFELSRSISIANNNQEFLKFLDKKIKKYC